VTVRASTASASVEILLGVVFCIEERVYAMTVAWDLRICVGVCPSYNDLGLLWFLGLMGQMLWRARRLSGFVELPHLLYQLSERDRATLFFQAKSFPMTFGYMENLAKDVPLGDVAVGLGNVGISDAVAIVAPYNAKAQFVFTVVWLTVFEDGFG
jgi:hypothetical protein